MSDTTEQDAALRVVHTKLKEIRERQDLTIRPTRHLRESILNDLGEEVPFNLRYYQVQGVLHLVSMRRFVLGDDTGLGKTAETIASLCFLWEKDPALKVIVLTTKSAAPQWVAEFERFTRDITVILAPDKQKKREKTYQEFLASSGPSVLVMNYSKLRNDFLTIKDWTPGVLVLDEVSAVKNPSSKIHKVCKHVSKQAGRVWGLSATIIKNNLIEGYAIYKVVVPWLFDSQNKFMHEYCRVQYQTIPGKRHKIPRIIGYLDRDIAAFREKIDPYFLGRAKHDVAKELPLLTTREVLVDLNPTQRSLYKEALSGILTVGAGDTAEERDVSKLTAIIYCQQVVNHPSLIGREGDSTKFDVLMDLLQEGDLAGEKVVVFTRFKKMVDIIAPTINSAFRDDNYCVRITGDEDGEGRARSQKMFQDPKSSTRVVCITMAGSDAINLQAAKAIIFYDLPWSAGDYLQILGRMIRIGTKHENVHALHLIARATIDKRTSQVLKEKMDVLEKVLGERIQGAGNTFVDTGSSGLGDIFALLNIDAIEASRGA